MNRIEARFKSLADRGEPAFIPYIVAGDPTIEQSRQIVLELERNGSDIIELGVPFSDPVADGPANQEGALRALRHGISLHDVLGLVREVRKESEVPLLLFTYFNPVLAYGFEAFADDAAAAGADGVLCVDLPIEEAAAYEQTMRQRGLATVFLVAPTSPDARIKEIVRHCTGFVYCVSRMGVTGESARVAGTVQSMVSRIKAHTSVPVAVGFGISTPEHAAEVAGYADGVVVGSAIVRVIGRYANDSDVAARAGALVAPLVQAAKQRKVQT